ncbi:RNA-binding Raly-like protein [Acipenser ruthenus]|uniref:RNA-binding Raly-like protein n=1 Tax=Acipenser ruthenus TaxID=7906 RepID=A0A444V5Q4_ACIRT|nr:RNA-binding Raly-like protein [Acipenser ruthenus]
MSRRKSRSGSPSHHTTNSNDPRDLERRIFVGNLPTNLMERKDLQELFMKYGKINVVPKRTNAEPPLPAWMKPLPCTLKP